MAQQPPQYYQQRTLVAVVVVVPLAIIVAVFLVKATVQSAQPVSCTIGVVGYAANVTFTDSDSNTSPAPINPSAVQPTDDVAQYDCNAIVSWAPRRYYLMTTDSPSGTEVCEGNFTTSSRYSSVDLPKGLYAGVHYVVRDTGAITLVGDQLCHDLNGPSQ